MKDISLRPRQEKAIKLVRDSFKAGNRKVVMMAATSFGKTRVCAQIIKSIIENGKTVYFICDRIVLIDQASKAFDEFNIPHGIIQADNERHRPNEPLQVCSIQTIANKKNLSADFCIVDEAHSMYKSQIKMMDTWNNVRFLGVTATPFTVGMGKVWDSLVVAARTQELIDEGFLTPFIVYGSPPLDLRKVKVQAGDYNQKDLADAVDKPPIIGDVLNNWLKHGESRQTICSSVSIVHSKHIVEQFNSVGIPSAHIDCYTSSEDREKMYDDFKSKKLTMLSSVDILTKGFDAPFVSCVIMARPTKSLTFFIQLAGRGCRIHPNKENCIILDHGGNVLRHGFPSDPLPEMLNHDTKADVAEPKKKEDLPKLCTKCNFMKPPKTHECTKCGFKPEKVNEIEHTDDTLIKIDKVDTAEKLKWYAMFLYYARYKKWQDGAASHMYKMKYKVWPHKKLGVHPIKPDEEVKNYIHYYNIRKAKARSKNVNN